MPIGILNPKDYIHSTSVKPAYVLSGVNQRRYYSDDLTTFITQQDFNQLSEQFRYAADFYGVPDVEGDDTVLKKIVAAGAGSLSGNLLLFQGLVGSPDKVPYFTSASAMALMTVTSFSRTLLAKTNATQWKDALGISAAMSGNVIALGNLVSGPDLLPYFNGVESMGTVPFKSYGRSLVGQIDAAATRTYLGLGTAAIYDESHFVLPSALATYAPLASPAFTGNPTAPTQLQADNSTKLSTTAYVRAAIAALNAIAFSGSASDLTVGTIPAARLPTSLSTIYGLAPTSNTFPYYPTGSSAALTSLTPFARTVLDDADAPTFRTTLGLGTAALQSDTYFATAVSPALSGTPTAPTALAGTNTTQIATTAFVQAAVTGFSGGLAPIATSGSASDLTTGTIPSGRLPASLSTIYILTPAADRLPYYTGTGAAALATFTSFARTLVNDPDAPTARTTLGLVTVASSGLASDLSGTLNSAQLPASLSSIYTLTPAADRLPYYTSASVAALATFTAFGRSLIDDVDAATARGTLGLGTAATQNTGTSGATVPLLSTANTWTTTQAFSVSPTAPNPPTADNSNLLATTAYVKGQAYAPLASPAFTGTPTAPTATAGTNTTQLATTAFVTAGLALKADLASPALTGTPTAPTAAFGTATTQIATTDFVANAVSGGVGGFAPLADPVFTGDPRAPTPATADNDTSIATTAYVKANLASYATLVSPSFTGTVTAAALTVDAGNLAVNRIGDANPANLLLQGDAGQNRQLLGYTGSSLRWNIQLGNNAAESTGNAGSNFGIIRYDDTGTFIDTILSAVRSTGIFSFTYSPVAPTPAIGDNSTTLATTAYVRNQAYAPLASPALTGTPTAPTAVAGTNTTQLATTAFVQAATTALNLSNYALLAGATFTGAVAATMLTANHGPVVANRTGDAAAANLQLQSDAGYGNQLIGYTGASLRWNLVLGNNAAETGSDAGKNFQLIAYSDTGPVIDIPISITRAAGGAMTIARPVTVSSGALQITAGSIITSGGYIQIARGGDAAAASFYMDADAGQLVQILFRSGATGNINRWLLYKSATAEAGSNAGSDLILNAYDDAGTGLGQVFTIIRATRIFSFTISPTAPTPTAGDSSTQLATTAFVAASFAPIGNPTFTGTANFAALAATGAVSGAQVTANAGSLLVDRTGDAAATQLIVRGDAGFVRSLYFQTGLSGRWELRGADNVAEAGGNAGSNMQLYAYDDTGISLGSVFSITRATRIVAFNLSPTAPTPTAGTNTTQLATTAFVAASFLTTASAASTYAPLASPTFTGQVTADTLVANAGPVICNRVGDTASASLQLQANAGWNRQIAAYTGSSLRWLLQLGNSIAESGANAGSNFALNRYDDAGAVIDAPLTMLRSTGQLALIQPLKITDDPLYVAGSGAGAASTRTAWRLVDYCPGLGTATGAIVFHAPNDGAEIMHQLKVRGRVHATVGTIDFSVHGYRATGTGAWGLYSVSHFGEVRPMVRWGIDTTGKACLILGDVTSTWAWPEIAIIEAMFHHSGANVDTVAYGWTADLVTDLSLYTNVTTDLTLSDSGSAPLNGAAFTGAVSANSLTANAGPVFVDRIGDAAAAQIFLRGDAGFARDFAFQTGTQNRFLFKTDGVAEVGSNAGSNFAMYSYDDTGTLIGNVFTVTRATRVLAFAISPTAPTPSTADSSTALATTAFVKNQAYAPLASPTFTGGIILNSGGFSISRVGEAVATNFQMYADAGQPRQIVSYTGAASLRWILQFGTSYAETGGNVGSDIILKRYSDAGAFIDNPLVVTRSTGICAFTSSPTGPTPTAGDSSTQLATTAFVATSFAPKASPTFTGTITTDALTVAAGGLILNRTGDAAAALFAIQGDAGQNRQIAWYTGGSIRWNLILGNTVAESGGNAGSNAVMNAYDDAGAFLGSVFNITRATRIMAFTVSPTAPTPAVLDNSTSVATTSYVDNADNHYPSVVNVTAASPVIAVSHYGELLRLNSGTAQTVALPDDATLNVPIGTWIDFMQWSTGQTTFTPGGTAAIYGRGGLTKTLRYGIVRAVKVLANTWVLSGDGLSA